MPKKLILASGSPRRKDLLELAGFHIDAVIPANIEEVRQKNEAINAYITRLAAEKCETVFKDNPEAVVLAADTVVVKGKRVLEKPKDAAEERAFLTLLSGTQHQVVTAMCVMGPDKTGAAMQPAQKMSRTFVKFKRLTRADIDWFIATNDWKDKSGGYGLQGPASAFVKSVNGSVSSVIGLDIRAATETLQSFGIARQQN